MALDAQILFLKGLLEVHLAEMLVVFAPCVTCIDFEEEHNPR